MEASFRAGKKANSQVAAAAAAAGGAEPAPAAPAAAAAPAKKASKPRLPALDSLRFFLIAYIAVGHFVAFATRDPFLLKLLTQVRDPVCAAVGMLGCSVAWAGRQIAPYAASAHAASCLGLRPLPQVNVWVGPFFVLSGYVAGYTATELGKYEASSRVKPAGAYTVARVAGFYPLFALIQVGFGRAVRTEGGGTASGCA